MGRKNRLPEQPKEKDEAIPIEAGAPIQREPTPALPAEVTQLPPLPPPAPEPILIDVQVVEGQVQLLFSRSTPFVGMPPEAARALADRIRGKAAEIAWGS